LYLPDELVTRNLAFFANIALVYEILYQVRSRYAYQPSVKGYSVLVET